MTPNVLLVDYDPRSIRRLRGLLHEAGMQPLLATNGDAGIEAARSCRPDLVVVQDLVPRRHGFEVCREIKSAPDGAGRPVILLFSPRPGRRTAARATGCDAILEKPFPDEAFVSLVRRFFPEPSQRAEDEVVEEIGFVLERLFRPAAGSEATPPTEPPRPKRPARRAGGRKRRSAVAPAEPTP